MAFAAPVQAWVQTHESASFCGWREFPSLAGGSELDVGIAGLDSPTSPNLSMDELDWMDDVVEGPENKF